jgi:PAS domain S-box-containing protein
MKKRYVKHNTAADRGSALPSGLQDQSSYHESLLRSTSCAIVAADEDYRVVFWNPAAEELYGWSAEEAAGRKFLEVTVPGSGRRRAREILHEVKKGSDYQGELSLRKRDGTVFTALLACKSVTDDKGNNRGIVVVASDFSFYKQLQEALQSREIEIRAITDNLPALISYVDASGCYRFANKGYEEWFGVPCDDLIGKHYSRILGEAAGVTIKKYVQAALSGERVHFEKALAYKRAGRHWIAATYVPDTDEEGNTLGFYALVTDIDRRKQMEEALKTSKARLARAQRITRVGNWEWDVSRGEIFWSDEVYRILGLPKQTPSSELAESLVHPDDKEYCKTTVHEAVRQAKPIVLDCRALSSDGGTVWISVHSTCTSDRHRNLRYEGTVQDITRRKQVDEERERRVRELGFVNESIIKVSRIRNIDEMCRIAAEAVQSINQGSCVTVSFYDWEKGSIRVRAVAGLGEKYRDIERLLSVEPTQISGSASEMGAEARKAMLLFTSGKIELVPGGLVTLSDGMIPRESCRKIEEFLGIDKVYTVGFSLGKEAMGGLSVLLPTGQELRFGSAIETFANHLAVLMHRIQAEEELQESRERYRRLSHRLRTVREEQNAHLAREIHDDLGQSLTALEMDLSMVEQDVKRTDDRQNIQAILDTLKNMRKIIADTVEKTRNLAAMLRPSMLDTLGIVDVLEWQLQEFRKHSGISTSFRSNVSRIDLGKESSLAVYRIVQEALTNCARHAHATKLRVKIGKKDNRLVVEVKDNGAGFSHSKRNLRQSLGIIGMQEHAAACGGWLDIESVKGAGTTVRLQIPLQDAP